jgi:predicted nucleic acid-binding protein
LTVSVVIADANILFSRTLRDYVLYGDDVGGFEVRWSPAILAEMSRNLCAKRGLSLEQTDRLEQLMNAFLDDALVEVRVADEELVESVDMDPKDRHVLAAALSAGADIVLTDNVKHFPREWMAQRRIVLLTSAEFFVRVLDEAPDAMRAAHERTVASTPKSEDEVLEVLERIVGSDVVDQLRAVLKG